MLSRGGRFNRSLHNWTLMRLITMMNWAGEILTDRRLRGGRSRHQFFHCLPKHCAISKSWLGERARATNSGSSWWNFLQKNSVASGKNCADGDECYESIRKSLSPWKTQKRDMKTRRCRFLHIFRNFVLLAHQPQGFRSLISRSTSDAFRFHAQCSVNVFIIDGFHRFLSASIKNRSSAFLCQLFPAYRRIYWIGQGSWIEFS